MKMGAGMTKGGKKPKAMPRRDAIAGPLGAVARYDRNQHSRQPNRLGGLACHHETTPRCS